MKTIYLGIAMLFTTAMSIAQGSLNIYGLPNLTKGYAAWSIDDQNRNHYKVYIIENTISGSSVNQNIIDRHELWGVNYLKIKDEY